MSISIHFECQLAEILIEQNSDYLKKS